MGRSSSRTLQGWGALETLAGSDPEDWLDLAPTFAGADQGDLTSRLDTANPAAAAWLVLGLATVHSREDDPNSVFQQVFTTPHFEAHLALLRCVAAGRFGLGTGLIDPLRHAFAKARPMYPRVAARVAGSPDLQSLHKLSERAERDPHSRLEVAMARQLLATAEALNLHPPDRMGPTADLDTEVLGQFFERGPGRAEASRAIEDLFRNGDLPGLEVAHHHLIRGQPIEEHLADRLLVVETLHPEVDRRRDAFERLSLRRRTPVDTALRGLRDPSPLVSALAADALVQRHKLGGILLADADEARQHRRRQSLLEALASPWEHTRQNTVEVLEAMGARWAGTTLRREKALASGQTRVAMRRALSVLAGPPGDSFIERVPGQDLVVDYVGLGLWPIELVGRAIVRYRFVLTANGTWDTLALEPLVGLELDREGLRLLAYAPVVLDGKTVETAVTPLREPADVNVAGQRWRIRPVPSESGVFWLVTRGEPMTCARVRSTDRIDIGRRIEGRGLVLPDRQAGKVRYRDGRLGRMAQEGSMSIDKLTAHRLHASLQNRGRRAILSMYGSIPSWVEHGGRMHRIRGATTLDGGATVLLGCDVAQLRWDDKPSRVEGREPM